MATKRKVQVGDRIWARHGGLHVVCGLARGRALVGYGSHYYETRRLEWNAVTLHWDLA